MMFDTKVETPHVRLNPFVFPSATTTRFILFIIAIIGITLSVYSAAYISYLDDRRVLQEVRQQAVVCASRLESFSTILEKSIESGNPNLLASRNAAWNQCMDSFNRRIQESAWFALGIAAFLLGVSGVICSFLPFLIIRREKMVALETQPDLEEVVSYLRDLCQKVELPDSPKFLLKPTSRAIGGKVFGFWDRYYLVLPTGLIILYDRDREAFRSVILHELSHLKNRDIDITYFSIVAGYIFLIALLVPIPFIWHGDYFYILWRIIIFSLLIYLLMTAVVRSREFYADIRASIHLSPESIQHLLETFPQQKRLGQQSILASLLDRLLDFKHQYWQSAFKFHPASSERHQVLARPERLCYFNFWEAVSIGLVIAAAFNSVLVLVTPVLIKSLGQIKINLMPEPFITALFFSPFIAAIIGLGIWREVYASLTDNAIYRRSGKLGLGLGLGLIVGQVLSPYSTAEITPISIWHQPLMTIVWNLLWDILLLTCFYYFFEWVAICASSWLKVSIAYKSPRPFYATGIIVANIWLILLLIGFDYVRLFAHLLTPQSISELLIGLTLSLFIIGLSTYHLIVSIAFIILWSFPLSSWFWQRKLTGSTLVSRWVFLDSPCCQVYLPTYKKIQLYPALMLGLKGGLLYCLLLISILLLLRLVLPESVRETAVFKLLLFYAGFISLAVLMQVAIAIKTTKKIKYLGVIHGLFAAFIAACVMVLGAFVILVMFGGRLDLSFALMIFKMIVNWGALLSLLAVLFLSWTRTRRLESTL
jgi:Zn-dependent protease with chaperone function